MGFWFRTYDMAASFRHDEAYEKRLREAKVFCTFHTRLFVMPLCITTGLTRNATFTPSLIIITSVVVGQHL